MPQGQTVATVKILRIISLAMIADSLLYCVILFILRAAPGIMDFKPAFVFSNAFYLIFIPCFGIFLFSRYLRERLWESKKKSIISAEGFYSGLLPVTIITMVSLDTIGIAGIAVFLLTGNLSFSVLMMLISAACKALYYPTQNYIEQKKKEFFFLIP